MPGPMGGQMRGRGNVTREKMDFKSFFKLIKFSKPYYLLTIIAILCGVVGAITTIIGPDKVSELTNVILEGILGTIDMDKFSKIALTLVVLYILGAVFNYLQQFCMAIVSAGVSRTLRSNINEKINKLPLSFFDRTTKGDILSRITNDVDTISQTLGSSIANLMSSIILFVGVLVMMFKTNWILALTTIVSSFFGMFLSTFILTKAQKHFNNRQIYIGDLQGHIEEVYSNYNTVKSYNATKKESEQFCAHNSNIKNTTWKAQFLSGMMGPMMGFVGDLSYILIFVVGVSIALKGSGSVTLGTLMAFVIYARLFSQPLRTFGQSMGSIQQTSAASRRVFEILEADEQPSEEKKTEVLGSVKGNVRFNHVRFGYTPEKIIIKDFSADLKAGQKVAIVGPTGAGKTTMVNLLMRFYDIRQPRLIVNGRITDYKIFDNGKSIKICVNNVGQLKINGEEEDIFVKPEILESLPKNKEFKFDKEFNTIIDEKESDFKVEVLSGDSLNDVSGCLFGIAYYGDIFIDDTPIRVVTRENVRDLFDMILQDTWLFDGTVRENLVYNAKGVSEERLDEVTKAVGIFHYIQSLPDGYDSILDDQSLSEGQKQQFTIARAMIKDSPLLILDEATSNVDTKTELVIQNAMDKLTKGRTSFVIAHRLSTIKNADVILVMKNGNIIEQGSHKELLKQNGFYAELYNSQFSDNN